MNSSRLLRDASVFLIVSAVVFAAACNGASATSANAASNAGTPVVTPTGTSGSASAVIPAAGDRPVAESAVREVTLPAGTPLPIVLDTGVGSDTSRVEEQVHAHLARPVLVRGVTALGVGSRVSGDVSDATRSAKVKGRAHIAVRFDALTPEGPGSDHARYAIRTAAVGRTAPGTKKKDAVEIGAPAVGGAIIGALVGGKKGAVIGGAAGGGAGTAVVLSTRGKEVHLPQGARLTLRLSQPVTIRIH